MTRLKFRDFEFPHNPQKIQMEIKKNLKVFRPPNSDVIVQNLGADYRVVTGTGEFFGSDAFTYFLQLSAVFKQSEKGILTLPGMDSFYAEFHTLKLIGEAGDNLITYEFEFWEVPDAKVDSYSSKGTYVVGSEDNLWTISALTGVSVESMMRLNPKIKNPFNLTQGMELVLS